MSWFSGPNPSRVEMRVQLDLYLASIHETKKHIPTSRILVSSLWRKSRKIPYVDVWEELGAIEEVTEKGVVKGSALKSAFRRRLLELQQGRCCYCRRWLVNTAYAKPIEHILPKKHYPQYSIDFWNLAVACTDCNSEKSDDVWGGFSRTRRSYPRPTEFSEAYHPRFHRYDEHVRYMRVETNTTSMVMFFGLTNSGMHLCRSLLHKIAAKETLIQNNPTLAPLIEAIRTYAPKAEGLKMPDFKAFQETLERNLFRLLDESY